MCLYPGTKLCFSKGPCFIYFSVFIPQHCFQYKANEEHKFVTGISQMISPRLI